MNMPIIFILLILSSCTSLVLSSTNDELTLLKIKEQLGNPEILSSWVEGFDFCNGTDEASYHYAYIGCTSTGRVNSFDLGFMYYFSFSGQGFPDAICDLTELEHLSLSKLHGLRGPLPSCLNNLTNLRSIFFERTDIGGPLPELDNLKKLTNLYLEQNGFSGPIPASLSKLPNLHSLHLGQNQFSGSIPRDLVKGPDAYLSLHDNALSGEIPSCYGRLKFSLAIDFAGNDLSGDASSLFGKHSTLTYIDLSFNQFEFDLSNVEAPENLTGLDLSFNKIYGEVPESIAKIKGLNLVFNALCGKWPEIFPYPLLKHTWNGLYSLDRCLCGSPLPPCNSSAPASSP